MPGRASAHDPLEITTDAHIDARGLNVHTTWSLGTAARSCLTDVPSARRFSPADFPRFCPEFERCARDYYALSSGGKPLPLLSLSLQLSPEDDLEMRAVYPRPRESPLSFEALGLKRLPPAAGIVLTVTGQHSFLGQKLLRVDDARFERAITPEGEDLGAPALTPPGTRVRIANGLSTRGLVALAFLVFLVVAFFALRQRR